jgi:hypothetical protein
VTVLDCHRNSLPETAQRNAAKSRPGGSMKRQQPRQMFFSFAAVRASSSMYGSLWPDGASTDPATLVEPGFFNFGGNAAS